MHDYGLWGGAMTPSRYPLAKPDSVGVPPQAGETVLVAPFNETERAVALIEAHAHELAAVIVEPLQRVLLPEPGFLQAMRDVTRRHGIVLVFDEIVTGFRIAWGGAQEKYGVVPDVATYGKAVSGGFRSRPLPGARRMGVLDARRVRARVWWATHTQRKSVCAPRAAASASSQPGLYDRLHAVGRRLRERSRGRRASRLPRQAPGGTPCSASGSPIASRCTWMDLRRPTRRSDCAGRSSSSSAACWSINEKFYISIAHSDDDVIHAAIADEAFAALRA
jgi:glutamate-1-semialdehyde 2,1-aminomutase